MPTELELRFHEAMLDIYRRARDEVRYNATRYLQMVTERGGRAAAQALLEASGVSDGFTTLWERQRLDLSVEALILDPQWHDLFTDQERERATSRLRDYGYVPGGAAAIVGGDDVGCASLLTRITIRPGQCGGKPCIRGMRIRVADVLGLLARGLTPEQVLKELPDLEPDDIRASLQYAAQEMERGKRESA